MGGGPNSAGLIVSLPSEVPVASLGATVTLYRSPFLDSAGALTSAGILGWQLAALLGAPHCSIDSTAVGIPQ